jgi:hypothetical protein
MYNDNNWFDYINNNPDKPWNYLHLSANPNVTWEIIKLNKLNRKSTRHKNGVMKILVQIPI